MKIKNVSVLLAFVVLIPSFLVAQSVNFSEIPLYFTADNSSLASASIENHNISILFDSGSTTSFFLKKELLEKLRGITYTGNVNQHIDAKGRNFLTPEFVLENIAFDKYKIEHIAGEVYQPWGLTITIEDAPEANNIGNHEDTMSNVDGVFGAGLFKNKEMIIDYPNKKLIILHDGSLPDQYKNISWITCSKNIDDDGIILNAVINGKKGRFILDTGATTSLLKPSFLNINDQKVQSVKETLFTEDHVDMGEVKFYLADFSEPQVDGFLGHNFFLNRIVYIDNPDILENKNGFCYIHKLPFDLNTFNGH